ncbi:MAG: hypothetical protein ACRD0X_04290 [Thermoanaerobaculia bacterium]
MQTTLRLDERIYRRAKARAAEAGLSLTKYVEMALRSRLEAPVVRRRVRTPLPVSAARGGLLPGFGTLEEAVGAAELAADRRRAR